MRHFDVQLVGGMALHDGRLAEMATGNIILYIYYLLLNFLNIWNIYLGRGVQQIYFSIYLYYIYYIL